MKRQIYATLGTFALFAALAAPVSVPATPGRKPQPAPAAQPAPEPHPEIHDALEALRRARRHMAEAEHDFRRYDKADALRATDDAIRQLEICMKFDR